MTVTGSAVGVIAVATPFALLAVLLAPTFVQRVRTARRVTRRFAAGAGNPASRFPAVPSPTGAAVSRLAERDVS